MFRGVTRVAGSSNKDLLIGINSTHFLKKTSASGAVEASPLPAPYVEPLTLGYDDDDQIIIGPVSHGMTVFLDVCKTNANLAAVRRDGELFCCSFLEGAC